MSIATKRTVRFSLAAFLLCGGCAWGPSPSDDSKSLDSVANRQASLDSHAHAADSPESRFAAAADVDGAEANRFHDATNAKLADARREGLIDAATESQLRTTLSEASPEMRETILTQVLAMRRFDLDRREDKPRAKASDANSLARNDRDSQNSIDRREQATVAKTPINVLRDRPDDRTANEQARVDDSVRTASATAPKSENSAIRQPTGLRSNERNRAPSRLDALAVNRHDSAADAPFEAGEEWKIMLKPAIRSLEDQMRVGRADERRQAALRMLHLLVDERDDALRPLENVDPQVAAFWNDWLYGTSIYLDEEAMKDEPRRAALAAHHLRKAVGELAARGNMTVKNVAFCRRVSSFGVHETLAEKTDDGGLQYRFRPGQEVLLYAEVENFSSVESPKGFHTILKASYAIVNARGEREIPMRELDVSHDYCQDRRTDFFVRYHVYLPAQIRPGRYKLELEVVDEQSDKLGQASVEFLIAGE